MTALTKYARIEATGLWRPSPDAQRREVIVSIGDATLVISDLRDQALTHWSLAAVMRADTGQRPALYHPDGDPSETLELPDDEEQMIDAIETLRRAISRSRPRTGRLRWVGMAVSMTLVLALALFWLPGALQDHTLRVVPKANRGAIGDALLARIERVSGPVCSDRDGKRALARLGTRLAVGKIAVLPDMARASLHLPGNLLLLDRRLLEQYEEPDVAAGYLLNEDSLRRAGDPLRDLLAAVGLWENFRLLTTGNIAPEALDAYVQHLLTAPRPQAEATALLARFEAAEMRSAPYAYAKDARGETTLALIKGDPMTGRATQPLLSDADWLRLQNICGS
ncbi:hypothetical protein ACFSUD_15035 [Sulfitobacter aestuarii]|uniref:Uncharacterized protein n=1 Tax=Sulfitobacter aestuarii TaxID=2161676 RepID=A0ABW5U4S8_9RHOB